MGPLVKDLIKTHKIRYASIDVARLITHETGEKEISGPVVVWIGVYPGSTAADTAHDISERILTLLIYRTVSSSPVQERGQQQ